MPHLPGRVHLVAQAPELDAERLLRAVADAHIAEIAPAGMVGVFDDVAGGVLVARAEVDGIHDLRADLAGPLRELVQAHFVGLRGEPGKVQPPRPLFPGADAVLPVEAGDEIAAGIAYDRYAQALHKLDHIPAETKAVRQRMLRLINAAVDRAAKMLDKRAVQSGVDRADRVVPIQNQFCPFHALRRLPSSQNARLSSLIHPPPGGAALQARRSLALRIAGRAGMPALFFRPTLQ